MCTPLPFCWGVEGWAADQIFKKGGGGLIGSQFLEGVAGEKGVTFFMLKGAGEGVAVFT